MYILSDTNRKLQAALDAVKRGWFVLPVYNTVDMDCACGNSKCKSQGKHPHSALVPRGLTQATCDEAQVRRWWAQDPDANIGVVMQPSGLVARDVDVYNADDVKLQALVNRLGDLPRAPEQISGSKEGVHVLFKHPGIPIRGNIEGITMRSKAYIVIAPSKHKSGNEYRWDDDPDTTPAPHLPKAWIEALSKDVDLGDGSSANIPSAPDEPEWLRNVSVSDRVVAMHAHLSKENGEEMGVSPPGMMFNITRTAIRGFAIRDPEKVYEALKSYNERCTPPYSDERLGNIINNVFEKAVEPNWGERILQKVSIEKKPAIHEDEYKDHLRARARALAQSEDEDEQVRYKVLRSILDYKLGEKQVTDAEGYTFYTQVLVEESKLGTTDEQLKTSLFGLFKGVTIEEIDELIQDVKSKGSLKDFKAREALKIRLKLTGKGCVKGGGFNISIILKEDPALFGFIRFNELYKSIEITGGVLKGAGANDIPVLLKNWLEEWWDITASSTEVGEQLLTMARRHFAYDPVGTYLRALVWDKVPRLDDWLIHYANAKTMSQSGKDITTYVKQVSARWMISAVARALKPGSKVDTVLVLEGIQGAKKSTALDILGDIWFTDSPISLGSKDSMMLAAARWICELAELAAVMKSDVESQKAFISARKDDFRPPYGKAIEPFDRRCVFAGTVNPTKDGEVDYLVDETGDRRWWPIRVTGKVKAEDLRDDRDQLWAEATFRYLSSEINPDLANKTIPGERWWFELEEQSDINHILQERHAESTWSQAIASWVDSQARHTSSMLGMTKPSDRNAWTLQVIAAGALKIEINQISHQQRKISAACREAGLMPRKVRDNGREVRVWARTDAGIN